MLSVVALGFVVLLAQQAPSWSELSQLGVVAMALIVGAVGTGIALQRWVLKPAEERYQQERAERIATQADIKEVLQLTIPVVAQANANHATMMSVLSRGEGHR